MFLLSMSEIFYHATQHINVEAISAHRQPQRNVLKIAHSEFLVKLSNRCADSDSANTVLSPNTIDHDMISSQSNKTN